MKQYGARHLVKYVLVLLVTVGCDAPSGQVPVAECKVPGATVELQRALCTASSHDLDRAIVPLRSSARESADRIAAAAPVLERVWRGDRTVGTGLPWAELNEPVFRSAVVQYLAQAVRNGQAKVDLKSLQDFAIEYSVADIPTGVVGGIRLLGLTDAPGQVPTLEHLARQGSNEGQRIEAIAALGNLCDPAAEPLLKKLQNDATLPEKERNFVMVALSQSEQNKQGWCRGR